MKKMFSIPLVLTGISLLFGLWWEISSSSPSIQNKKVLAAPPPLDDGTGRAVNPSLWKKALSLHEKAIVIDTHCDVPTRVYYGSFDMASRNESGHFDLERMREGGLDAEFLVVWIPNREDEKHPAKQALEEIDLIYQAVESRPDIAAMAFSPEDIERLAVQGKSACLMGLENGSPVEKSLRLLRTFYRLGIRYCTLTHSKHNAICDSSFDESPPRWNGLSPFGKEMVREMNRLGMIVDIAHLSDQSIEAVLRESSAPVIDTHSGIRALCPMHPFQRNRTDDQIKAIARKGGVLHINFGAFFLDKEWAERSMKRQKMLKTREEELKELFKDDLEAFRNAYKDLRKGSSIPPPPLSCLMDHIDYVVRLVGADFVGLGSDFDGVDTLARGIDSVKDIPLITYHLLKRGYSEEVVLKILGRNFLRAFREIRKTAQRLR